ncbi:uncharacterized protein LOC134829656 isoform X1 [Culicoides brevitarsis]|uniref:uncharacterized protein LOC134829656 isoform X1 n=1 Tax=Culicoides brevitarsis TaxID=469753 RepID=UPI00307CACEE
MENYLKILAFTTLFLQKSVFADTVPVFIFGKTLPKVPALVDIDSSRFLSLIRPEINKNLIVVIVSPTLKIEDITKCRGEDCLYKFSENFSYLPRVKTPNKAFVEAVNTTFDDIFEKINQGERFLVVNSIENPQKLLPSLYKTISKAHPDVILIFTGQKSSHHIEKRSIDHAPLESRYVRIAAQGISERSGQGSESVTDIQSIATKINGSSLFATLFPLNFTLKFILQGNVWSLKSASKGDFSYKIPKYVTAIDSYSYRCEENLTFHHGFDVIKIMNSQILVSFIEDHPKFDLKKVFYCDSYTSPGILAGLTVAAILLGVLFLSLMCIADIRTMDRFDNQRKGLIIAFDE